MFNGNAVGFEGESGKEILKSGTGGERREAARLTVDDEIHGVRVQGAENSRRHWKATEFRRPVWNLFSAGKRTEDLPSEASQEDEDGFEDEGEGETAEGAEIDFRRAVRAHAGDGAGRVYQWFSGEVCKVER
jgi:hypothetical protein